MDHRNERERVAGDKLRETLVLPAAAQPVPSFDAVGTARDDEFASVRIGGKIDGYKVEAPLAEGGMGGIYRVKDRQGDRDLALKAPLPDGRGGTYTHRMRRFLREVRLASRMNHPGVAKVVEVGQNDGLPYFTMELVDGQPLSDRMCFGPLEVRDAVAVMESAARGVHHVHEKGVIHRDLKPQNILVQKDGTAVVIDFGLARDAAGIDPRITQSGVWLGTPAYISPEQASGAASTVDARADVYSLGAVLYEALTGTPPYGAGAPRQIFRNMKQGTVVSIRALRSEVPAEVEAVVMKAIARTAADRYATALELADALAAVLAKLARSPLSSTGAVDIELSDPSLTPVTERDLREIAPKAATKKNATPAPEELDLWLQAGTSNAVAKDAKVLLDGEAGERDPAPRRRGSDSTHRRRARKSARKSDLIFDPEGTTDAAHLLAFGGPALIAMFGLLLLLL